jgi:RimJ/RimL family protein N-acetyltransferase
MTVFDTLRLTIRPWTEGDAADMHALVFGDAEAMRFWNMPVSRSEKEMARSIRRSRAASPIKHVGWAVVLKETGQGIGFLNFHHRDIASRRLEIGYIIGRAFWQRGYGREAVSALLGHCFDVMQCHRVEATIDPANTASRRLAERLGFRQEGGPMRQRLKMPDGRFADILMYGLLAADWVARGQ